MGLSTAGYFVLQESFIAFITFLFFGFPYIAHKSVFRTISCSAAELFTDMSQHGVIGGHVHIRAVAGKVEAVLQESGANEYRDHPGTFLPAT